MQFGRYFAPRICVTRFFSDDLCSEELPKDDPITSGHLYDTSSLSAADLYGPAKAFDGNDEDEPGNIFAANCRVDWQREPSVPSILTGSPKTNPVALRALMMLMRARASSVNL